MPSAFIRPRIRPPNRGRKLDFIARLAALVPRPRAHLVRYHGLFALIAHGSAGAAKHMAGIVPDNPLHSRHCTWMCRTLIARITRTLVRGGELIEEPEHPYLDLELNSPLEQLSAVAVRYRIALGPQAGRKTMTLRNPGAMVDEATSSKPFTAARDGFSINAVVGCESSE